MILKEVTLHKYKCVESEQSFKIEDNITVLVGMNESGKTAVLKSIAKTNYFQKDKKFTFSTTQNQALCAIIFLYKNVLKKELENTISIYWSKRPKKLPVVFTKSEAIEVLNNLKGIHWLVGMLLYGSGLRLSESLELRIKDIDFGYNQIIVRNSKGEKDRATMLPQKIIEPLKEHLNKVKKYMIKI